MAVTADPGPDTLPARIVPGDLGVSGTPDALTNWAAANRHRFDTWLSEHGALLFRGFGFDSAEAFQTFGRAVSKGFLDYFAGATGRKRVYEEVSTSTELEAWKPLALHCELSYMNRYPSRVLFYCEVPPDQGGQTPIGFMNEIHDALDPTLRERFNRNGVILQREFSALTWPKKLQSAQRDEAKRLAAARGIELDWRRDGSVRLTHCRPATFRHTNGKTMWFNQVHMIHPSWSWEFARAGRFRRAAMHWTNELRLGLNRRLDVLACGCYYGDGEVISRSAVSEVRKAHWACARMFEWQEGDVLVIDNLQVAHGRMPFRGNRKILALLADAVTDDDLECGPFPGGIKSGVSAAAHRPIEFRIGVGPNKFDY